MNHSSRSIAGRKSVTGIVVQVDTSPIGGKENTDKNEQLWSERALLVQKCRLWGVFLMAIAAFVLSAVSFTQESSNWLIAEGQHNAGRVGWRRACVDRTKTDGVISYTMPCRPGDDIEAIEHTISKDAADFGKTALVITIITWVLPLLLLPCFCLDCTNDKRTFHGRQFCIALLWAMAGTALLATSVLFGDEVNRIHTTNDDLRWSVTCTSSTQTEIAICRDAASITECHPGCHFAGTNDVVCAGFRDCILYDRSATCDLDNVGCEMHLGWALKTSMTSSVLIFLSAILLAMGSCTSVMPTHA